MLIVGSKERDSGTVSVRHRREGGDLGSLGLSEFAETIKKEIKQKDH